MTQTATAHPPIVARSEWLAARKQLLAHERELTRQRDAVSAARRRLPMVAIDKAYTFDGPAGKVSLLDLFDSRCQLIVYHFMFDPSDPPPGQSAPWSEGCPGCSHIADNLPHLSHLHARDTSLVMVSRAPQSKIAPFKKRMGWTAPWFSSFGTDFNYDFNVTMDEAVRPVEYNYKDKATLEREGLTYHLQGEQPGASIFLRLPDERGGPHDRVFHTYSTYGRGLDPLMATYHYLDLTPFGRQEDWEDSPAGWPQTPTYPGWLRHHDKYAAECPNCCCRSAQTS